MFKIGEKVRVKDKYTHEIYNDDVRELAGKVVTISKITEYGDYHIEEDYGKYKWLNNDLEKIEESDSMFKVGDRVKIGDLDLTVRPYNFMMEEVKFKEGEILEVDQSDNTALIDLSEFELYSAWIRLEDLTLVEEDSKVSHNFKVGDKVRILDVDLEDDFYAYEMRETIDEIGTIRKIYDDHVEVYFEDDYWHYRFEDIEVLDFVPKYKVGDKVRILSDDISAFYNEGDVAEIISVDYDDEYLTYELEHTWVEEDDIELVVEESEFNIGDRVKIVSMNGGETESSIFEVGHIGTITEIGGYHGLDANVVRLDNSMIGWVDTEDLELIETEKELEFKVGDKVRIVGTKSVDFYEIGDIAEIISVDYGITDLPYELEDDWVNGDDLELVEDVEEVELKVGDKVKIVGDYFAESYFVGETAEILRVDTNDETYLVYIESRDCNDWVDYTDVELIENEVEFEVGDKVRVVSRNHYPTISSVYRVGDTVIITKVDSDDNDVVNLDDDACGWVDTEDLVHVDFTFEEVQEELGIKFMTLEEIEEELGYDVVIVSKR